MLIIVPILALILLAWAPSPVRPPRLRHLTLPVLGILTTFVLIRQGVPDRWLYPDSRSMLVTEGVVAHLRSQQNWKSKPIIILEGGSLTYYGIDGMLIERILKARGIEAVVLEFACAGANHFERLKMFKEFLSCLTAVEREMLRDAHVLLLREVYREYDRSPTRYLESQNINRNVIYTEGSVFLPAWRACAHSPESRVLHWNLVKCTLLHEFAVGRLSTLKIPGPLEKAKSFCGLPPRGKPEFDFEKNWNYFINSYVQGASAIADLENVPCPGWMDAQQNLMTEMKGYIDLRGYFALPVLSAEEFAYQSTFLKALPPDAIILGPPRREVFQRLSSQKFWYDPTHLSIYGAQVATEWMTDEFYREWDDWMTKLDKPEIQSTLQRSALAY